MNYFKKVFNFIFPQTKIEEKKILEILKRRIIYFSLEKRIIFLPYKNTFVRDAIWSMKFKNNFSAARFFGSLIYENLPDILHGLEISENFNDPVLIQIPISRSKKLARGYNQNNVVLEHFYKLGGNNFIR